MRIEAKVPRSLTFLLAMTVLLGVAYPALVTGIAQLAFPRQANGSLIAKEGKVRGSSLLAQKFESPIFFRARPSATDYAYVGAGASNLGPTSAALEKAVEERRAAWEKDFGPGVPGEMLYASASGLDPDISLEAALAQEPRVAAARGLDRAASEALKEELRAEAEASASLIGARRINVTKLNARIDAEATLSGSGR
jgi:potassium-transporting ATPase KdpC subunit